MARPLPKSIDETHKLLGEADYVADRSLAIALYLSLAIQRPLFLEGEAGVGKKDRQINSARFTYCAARVGLAPVLGERDWCLRAFCA